MSTYFNYERTSDETVLLTEAEIEDPERVFMEFFSNNSLFEMRHYLSSTLEVCATTENQPFKQAEDRARLFILNHGLGRLIEACKIIVNKRTASDDYDHFD